MHSEQSQSIFEMVESERSVRLSIDGMAKGIDNYHIDVRLSRKFSSDVKKLVALLIAQNAVSNPRSWDNSQIFDRFRDRYLDLMTMLIHRVKTDLGPEQICFLQFAPIKHVVRIARSQLDEEIRQISARLAEHRHKGSSEALATQQRLYWLKKNYDAILYEVNRHVFTQMQRVEERQLQSIREQYLGEEYGYMVAALINPLLYPSELSALPLLLHEFSAWSWNGEDSGFVDLNLQVEKLFAKRLQVLGETTLRQANAQDSMALEIHDELGGLFRSQPYLGQAEDTKTVIDAKFNWFDLPGNIELLFNIKQTAQRLADIRKEKGFTAWWSSMLDARRLNKTLKAFSTLLRKSKLLPQLLSSHYMRRSLSPILLEHIDLKIICQYLSGQIEIGKLLENVNAGYKLSSEQLKSLVSLREKIQQQIKKSDQTDSLKLLLDMSRYRQQLKLFRFAHRAFNRISILTSAEDIKLSKAGGTLYQLPTSEETEEEDARICHHAILKADVRGSTVVTDELNEKGLNPASYFSVRFFNPINQILETYGANKVFIEGDAIILSFLEYEHSPQQWFAVSRACGYAKDMLKITGSSNRYSTQMSLPLLELGVGICYTANAPNFLYDGEHPIMISSAIGLADRLSGCSWKLRAAIKKRLFNVDVLRIAEGDNDAGEKGQHYLRYNVNGITIDEMAFKKLKTEISLKSLRMKLNGKDYLFHVGQYPDAHGRKKDLVIREGKVGLWQDSLIQDDPDSDESYYEIVVNRKGLPLVLKASPGTAAVSID